MKLLIIDDEKTSRETVKMLVDFAKFGFDELYEASNGQEALRVIRTTPIDLIITDMKMPKVDGISLLNIISDMKLNTSIIVISGFSDFEYTKAAISSNVVEYILKPIKKEELVAAVIKAITQKHGSSIKPSVEDTALLQFNKQYIQSRQMPGISIHEGYFDESDSLLLFAGIILNFEIVKNRSFQGFQELLYYTFEEFLRRQLHDETYSFMVKIIKENHYFVVIFSFRNRNPLLENLKLTLNTTVENAFNRWQMELLCIFDSDTTFYIDDLNKRFHVIEKQIKNMNILSRQRIFSVDAKHPEMNINRYTFRKSENLLLYAINQGDSKNVSMIIDALFSAIYSNQELTLRQLEFMCIDFVSIVISYLNGQRGYDESILSLDMLYDFINFSGDLERTRQWMLDTADKLIQHSLKTGNGTGTEVLNDILRYIDTYYSQKISLSMLSQKFYLSKEYISRLFKKIGNANFVDYLSQVRLAKARELLSDSSLKLQTISDMVGFSDISYFSNVFKKHYGVSPSEYRKNLSK